MRKMVTKEIVCSVCGKKVQLFNYKKDYLYKVQHYGKMYYQCSEKCWRIEKGEIK